MGDGSRDQLQGTSWLNTDEVAAVVQLILRMKSAAPPPFNARQAVGVITMYVAQQEALLRALDSAHLNGVRVSTVDGFQGGEMDVVIVTFVRNAVTSFLSNAKRVNVALTRARYYCVVVGNAAALSVDPLLGSLVHSFTGDQASGRGRREGETDRRASAMLTLHRL